MVIVVQCIGIGIISILMGVKKKIALENLECCWKCLTNNHYKSPIGYVTVQWKEIEIFDNGVLFDPSDVSLDCNVCDVSFAASLVWFFQTFQFCHGVDSHQAICHVWTASNNWNWRYKWNSTILFSFYSFFYFALSYLSELKKMNASDDNNNVHLCTYAWFLSFIDSDYNRVYNSSVWSLF